jgi:5-hydroxyisourate hydrolase-like protein (transthyretin family)
MTSGLLAALLLLFQIVAPAAKGSIEGVVLRAASGEPLSLAEVRLSRVRSDAEMNELYAAGIDPDSANPPVLTETDGKFSFKDLDAGQYRLIAARNGYPSQSYGQKTAGGAGATLNVRSGQSVRDVTFRMVQGGVVTGRVRDAAGEPVADLDVSLMRLTYNEFGKKTLSNIGETEETDDRGEYRLYWVEPGRYYVMASRGDGYGYSRSVVDRALPRVFHPGTLDPERASLLEVRSGAELTAIDIVLPSVAGYRVTGRLVESSTGKPPKTANIAMVSKKKQGAIVIDQQAEGAQYNSTTGAFQIRNVLPGSYWLTARTRNDYTQPVSAERLTELRTAEDLLRVAYENADRAAESRTEIEVTGSDLNDIVLTLKKGVSIQLHVRVEGQELATIKGGDSISVNLKPDFGGWHGTYRLNGQGIARINGVLPGDFETAVDFGTAKDLYVKEILYGRADALNESLRVTDQEPSTLAILLSTKGGQIEGQLTDALSQPVSGAEVVLIPERRDQRRLFKTTTADADGRFTFSALAPGGYKLFSWEVLEPWAYYDTEVLSRYETQGRSVRVQESSKETADLKIIPAPKP